MAHATVVVLISVPAAQKL